MVLCFFLTCSIISAETDPPTGLRCTSSCTNLPKRKEIPYIEMSRDNDQKSKQSLYTEMLSDNDQKKRITANVSSSKINLSISLSENIHFLQLPASYPFNPRLTTLTFPWTSQFVHFIVTLEDVKIGLEKFLGPKMTPIT